MLPLGRLLLVHSGRVVVADRDACFSRVAQRGLSAWLKLKPSGQHPLGWATALLGDRPNKASARRVYDQALTALAGYRLDHAITGREPLGPPPEDPFARRDYRRTVTIIERARQRLGLTGRPHHTPSAGVPHRYRTALGEPRTRALEALLQSARKRAAGLTADQLERAIAAARAALDTLDARAAAQALRLENQLAEHRRLADQGGERAHELAEHAQTLGWRQRSERQRLLDTAAALHGQADRHRADIERIELDLARLTATGRHPDQWLERHAHTVAHGLAAEAEHEQHREAEIDRQAARAALDPPAHVRELLGERPATDTKLAQAWQQLAIALDRHRRRYAIDVATDGPLGPIQAPRTQGCAQRSPTVTTATGSPVTSPACAISGAWALIRRSPIRVRAKRPTADPTRGDDTVNGRALDSPPEGK
jgi:hypothetical protein